MFSRRVQALLIPMIFTLSAGSAAAQTIPRTQTATLAGDPVTLPDTLKGRTGVLVVGFSQAAKEPVAAWGKRLYADFHDTTDVAFWEAGSLGGVPRLIRGLVIRQIKDSMPDRAQAHFLPLTENEAEWKTAAHFDKAHPDDAYVLLLDGNGTIRAQAEGAVTDSSYAAFRQQVESLRKAATPH